MPATVFVWRQCVQTTYKVCADGPSRSTVQLPFGCNRRPSLSFSPPPAALLSLESHVLKSQYLRTSQERCSNPASGLLDSVTAVSPVNPVPRGSTVAQGYEKESCLLKHLNHSARGLCPCCPLLRSQAWPLSPLSEEAVLPIYSYGQVYGLHNPRSSCISWPRTMDTAPWCEDVPKMECLPTSQGTWFRLGITDTSSAQRYI